MKKPKSKKVSKAKVKAVNANKSKPKQPDGLARRVRKSVAKALASKAITKAAGEIEGKTAKASKQEETMDRATLKSIASQLKDSGSDIKVLKSDTDDVLQKKVNDALQKLPAPEMIKKLESISPDKLVTVLKKDCLGIFIDLADVSCVRCPDVAACARDFIKNLKGDFTVADKAAADPPVEKKAAKTAVTPVTRYESKRLVFVRDVKNPNPKGDPYHDTIQVVLDDNPDTLGELRKIIEEDFDLDGDADFMKFVTTLRDPKEGVIKLDVDLSERDKVALRAAGYDV